MAWLGVRVLHFAAFCQKGQVSREDSRCVFFQPSLLRQSAFLPSYIVCTYGGLCGEQVNSSPWQPHRGPGS